jgi:hypothetical protein
MTLVLNDWAHDKSYACDVKSFVDDDFQGSEQVKIFIHCLRVISDVCVALHVVKSVRLTFLLSYLFSDMMLLNSFFDLLFSDVNCVDTCMGLLFFSHTVFTERAGNL